MISRLIWPSGLLTWPPSWFMITTQVNNLVVVLTIVFSCIGMIFNSWYELHALTSNGLLSIGCQTRIPIGAYSLLPKPASLMSQWLTKIKVWLLLCRFLSSRKIYPIHIVFVGLSVMQYSYDNYECTGPCLIFIHFHI